MQTAEHIIGLRAAEYAATDLNAAAIIIRMRYKEIRYAGILLPRTAEKSPGEDGNLFELDRLAGDGEYVFLSTGPRYRNSRPAEFCYGFVFDAEKLIREHGALIGPDLLQEYEDLMEAIIEEIDAELPPLPMATDEEIAEFAARLGESDPAMLTYIQEQSTSRAYDIDMAIRLGDMSVPGAEEAVKRFKSRSAVMRSLRRAAGDDALRLLRPGLEILVPGSLPLSEAIGYIDAGQQGAHHQCHCHKN